MNLSVACINIRPLPNSATSKNENSDENDRI